MTIRRASLALSAALLAAAPAHAAEPTSFCAKDKNPRCDEAASAAIDALLEQLGSTSDDARRDTALAIVDRVAADFPVLADDLYGDVDFKLWLWMGSKRDPGDPDFDAIVARMRGYAAKFRAARDVQRELFFLDWMSGGLPYDARFAFMRALHRRAAELGELGGRAANSARIVMEIQSNDMLQEGRHDEVVRALDDTFAELDAAGLHLVSVDLLRRYAEALTVARRDEESDRIFADLLVAIEREPEAYSNRAREYQLANNQISYYRNIVGRFAASEEPGRIAAVESERLEGREDINTQKARYNYAVALLGQGKAAEALPYFEEALPLQLAVEADPWSDRKTDTIILLTTLARARAQVAGREADGLAAAIDAADRLRVKRDAGFSSKNDANPAVAALAKAVARGTRRNPQSGAYDMVMFAGWAARSEDGALNAAFLAAQDLTLSDAGDAINEAAARDIAGTGPLGALVRQRQDAAQAVVALTQSYREKSLRADPAAADAMRAELDAAAQRLAPLDARLASEFPDYATLVAPRAIDVAAVQALLQPDEAVLMLLPSEGHHYAFAISKAAARWHRIDEGAAPVAADVARLKCRIDENTCSLTDYNALLEAQERGAPSPIDERYPRYDRAAAYHLYQELVAPVAEALPEGGRIYTVTSGPIAGLPLAALVASAPAGDAESGAVADLAATDWLAKHYRFVTLPSVSALALAQRADPPAAAARRPELVAYGAPTLIGSGKAAARGDGAPLRKRGGVGVRGAGLTLAGGDRTMASVDKLRRLDPLPGTVVELTKLSAAISRGGGVRLGAKATESAVKGDRELPRAISVVFATHGLLPGEMGTGSEPGLVLTPPGKASLTDDGLLTASEAAALSLSARWVVLSACNTATPGVEAGASGESLSSLARSFLYAGADNLLASHWRVADDATAALTVEALANRSASPATALAAAMEAVRTGKRTDGSAVEGWAPHWAHPASWAPFTLVTNRDR